MRSLPLSRQLLSHLKSGVDCHLFRGGIVRTFVAGMLVLAQVGHYAGIEGAEHLNWQFAFSAI